MMDYEIFKEEVSEKFRDFLPEEYQENGIYGSVLSKR